MNITRTGSSEQSRRQFLKKAGACGFMAPVVASYLVSDLVKSAHAQESYNSNAARFSKDAEGVITDTSTNLQWFTNPTIEQSWHQCNAWASGLAVSGGGWRLPTSAEMKGVHQMWTGDRNIDPVFGVRVNYLWCGNACSGGDHEVYNLQMYPDGAVQCMDSSWAKFFDQELSALAVRPLK